MPTESYSNTLNILGIPSLKDHHEQLCAKLLQSYYKFLNSPRFWGFFGAALMGDTAGHQPREPT